MIKGNRNTWLVPAAVAAALAAMGMAGLQAFIHVEARATGDRAMLDFPGDRVHALIQLVDCRECDLQQRNRAVWALGEMEDAAALPVLRRYHTGEACDHRVNICQYELGKAIKKIEGTWGLRASFSYKGK